jgi:hypothetical protein
MPRVSCFGKQAQVGDAKPFNQLFFFGQNFIVMWCIKQRMDE